MEKFSQSTGDGRLAITKQEKSRADRVGEYHLAIHKTGEELESMNMKDLKITFDTVKDFARIRPSKLKPRKKYEPKEDFARKQQSSMNHIDV